MECRRLRSGSRWAQRGQAIPIGIATMMFSIILALALFNTGQVTSEKTRLTNTADAAAYSGLVWQARALNFQSYTNRAMVANQVSIAQVISFVSWSNYLRIGARNLNNTIGWIPVVRPWTTAFQTFATNLENVVTRIASIAVPAIDRFLDVLRYSQSVVHFASALAAQEIVREVVRRNDPQYELTVLSAGFLAQNAVGWLNFTDSYDSNWAQKRKADIIMSPPGVIDASRDPFTYNRGWTLRGPPLPAPSGLGLMRIELVKAGETRLQSRGDVTDRRNSDLDWQWKGKDTLSLHFTWRCFGRWGRIRTCTQEIPIGWGAAYTSTDGSDLERNSDCGGFGFFSRNCSWSRNRMAERFADSEIVEIDGYRGIRAYREIADLNERDPTLGLAVEVRKIGTNVRTSTNAGIASPNSPRGSRNGIESGMFRLNDNFARGEMSAVSKAEVYFRRPTRRADGQDEYGNLFNPYWDVHLVSPRGERILAWASKGLVDLGDIVWNGGGSLPRN